MYTNAFSTDRGLNPIHYGNMHSAGERLCIQIPFFPTDKTFAKLLSILFVVYNVDESKALMEKGNDDLIPLIYQRYPKC